MSLLDKADISEQTAHERRSITGTDARRLRREAKALAVIKSIGGRWREGVVEPRKLQPTQLEGTNSDPTGFVYFVYCAGRIKIGFATNVANRFYSLATSCPFPPTLLMTISGTVEDEADFHQLFALERANLEWFLLSPNLRAFLAERLDEDGRSIFAKAERDGLDTLLWCAGEAIEQEADLPVPSLGVPVRA
jgi:hypothetical protein